MLIPAEKVKLVKQARRFAKRALAAGQTCIMVLYPDSTWGCCDSLRLKGVYQRHSDQHAGLKMLPVETLIVVAADLGGWDSDGLALAVERLRAQDGAVILILTSERPEITC